MIIIRLFFFMILLSFAVVAGLGLLLILRVRHWLRAPDIRPQGAAAPPPRDAGVIEGEYQVLDEKPR
jgi:hypothetical protein